MVLSRGLLNSNDAAEWLAKLCGAAAAPPAPATATNTTTTTSACAAATALLGRGMFATYDATKRAVGFCAELLSLLRAGGRGVGVGGGDYDKPRAWVDKSTSSVYFQEPALGSSSSQAYTLVRRALLRVDLEREASRDVLLRRHMFLARTGALPRLCWNNSEGTGGGGGATSPPRAPCTGDCPTTAARRGTWTLPPLARAGGGRGAAGLIAAKLRSQHFFSCLARRQARVAGRERTSEQRRAAGGRRPFSPGDARSGNPADGIWGGDELLRHEPLLAEGADGAPCSRLVFASPWSWAAYWSWRSWALLDAFTHWPDRVTPRWTATCTDLNKPLWHLEPVRLSGGDGAGVWTSCYQPLCPQPVSASFDWVQSQLPTEQEENQGQPRQALGTSSSWAAPDPDPDSVQRDTNQPPCGWDRCLCLAQQGRCSCYSDFLALPNTDPALLSLCPTASHGSPAPCARMPAASTCAAAAVRPSTPRTSPSIASTNPTPASSTTTTPAPPTATLPSATCPPSAACTPSRATPAAAGAAPWLKLSVPDSLARGVCDPAAGCSQCLAGYFGAYFFERETALRPARLQRARDFNYRLNRLLFDAYRLNLKQEEQVEASLRAAALGQRCLCEQGYGGRFCETRVCVPACHPAASCVLPKENGASPSALPTQFFQPLPQT
eukprot:g35156.t1